MYPPKNNTLQLKEHFRMVKYTLAIRAWVLFVYNIVFIAYHNVLHCYSTAILEGLIFILEKHCFYCKELKQTQCIYPQIIISKAICIELQKNCVYQWISPNCCLFVAFLLPWCENIWAVSWYTRSTVIGCVEKKQINELVEGDIEPTHHQLLLTLITLSTAWHFSTAGGTLLTSSSASHRCFGVEQRPLACDKVWSF